MQSLTAEVTACADRQIRLWGEQGQAALERASVCVINASATGTETLKNLVLPGIGAFTVVDGGEVAEGDYGNNFFLPQSGATYSSRAATAAEALQELNDGVSGSYIAQDVGTFLNDVDTARSFFGSFSLVIVTQMGSGHAAFMHIAEGCRLANVPLLIVRSYGLIGYMRIQIPEHCVLDSKEDALPPDLRVHRPFPDLLKYVNSFDMSAITDTTDAIHVPFVVMLAKAVDIFRARHNGNLPKTRPEKNEFSTIVNSFRPAVCPSVADNFDEALKFSNLRLCFEGADTIPDSVSAVLKDEKADPSAIGTAAQRPPPSAPRAPPMMPKPVPLSRGARSRCAVVAADDSEPNANNCTPAKVASVRITDEIASFWVHVAAVRMFVDENLVSVPLRGSLPDMTADTESYVALQRIYAEQASKDAAQVLRNATAIMEQQGVSVDCDETTVKSFCRNICGVRVLRYRSLKNELDNCPGSGFYESALMDGALDPSKRNSASSFYPLLRAVDAFYREHGRHAGAEPNLRESDSALVHEFLSKVKDDMGVGGGTTGLWRDEMDEVVRYANSEMHNVAAYMGGVAAQEAVKIVTRQFVPINNTLIVNFATQTSSTFAA